LSCPALQQGPQPLDHVASAPIVAMDVSHDRAQLVNVGRWLLQQQLRRFGITQDRAKRLAELVSERRRELTQRRHAPDVCKLAPQLVCISLGVLLVRNVAKHTSQ
jgi:uncharacterized protein with von Willebrand factor type A (vWA) domain